MSKVEAGIRETIKQVQDALNAQMPGQGFSVDEVSVVLSIRVINRDDQSVVVQQPSIAIVAAGTDHERVITGKPAQPRPEPAERVSGPVAVPSDQG
jgi:hypothetical protein